MNVLKVTLPKDSQVFVLEDSPMRQAWFRKRIPRVTVVDSVQGMIAYFETKPICDYIFLDHDLGDGNGNGVEAARWLKQKFGVNVSALLIHSWNTVGVRNMQDVLPGAPAIPFGNFDLEVEKD